VRRILVAAPLALEEALIRSGARGARVRKTGMGPDKSLAAVKRLAREPGDALLVLGFCGGLDAQARPGEVIVAEEVLTSADEGHDPVQAACHGAEQLMGALGDAGLSVRRGPIVGVGKIATGERREQLRAAGALAVDMESAWLAAGAAGRPFAVVRVVLDSPSHELFRPRALAGAVRAARALRSAARIALRDWAPPPPAQGSAGSAEPRGDDAGSTGLHDGARGV
jgi:4-hydroxy-3-methylbut-2-en-1-yl diphosphate reductase